MIEPFKSDVDVAKIERVQIPTDLLAGASLALYQKTTQQSGTISINSPVRFGQGQVLHTNEIHSNFSTLQGEQFSVYTEAVEVHERGGRYGSWEPQEPESPNAYRIAMFQYTPDGRNFAVQTSSFVIRQDLKLPDRELVEQLHVAAALHLLAGNGVEGAEEFISTHASTLELAVVSDRTKR